MDIKDIASDVIAIAKTLAPAVVPGAAPVIAAAEALLGLGEKLKPALKHLDEADAAELTVTLDDLAERVLAHADQTAANLRK